MDYFNDLNPYLVRQDPAPAETPDTTPTPAPAPTPNQTPGTPSTPSVTPAPVIDQAYVENILRINVGKLGTFYFTYTGSNEWRDRVFKGIIEQAGRDHFILHDPKTGKRYLLQLVYLEWAEFDEALNYQYPYQ